MPSRAMPAPRLSLYRCSRPNASPLAMNASGDPAAVKEVWRFVQELNRTWSQGDAKDLRGFFDADIVIIGPGFQGRSLGRDAAVASYVDFRAHATVITFAEREPEIDVNGQTAVVSYTFDIAYEIE